MNGTRPAVREATEADFPEILRLVYAMWIEMGLPATGGEWEEAAANAFRAGGPAGTVKGFVADRPDGEGLVACGAAVILHQLPTYWMPDGRMGYLQWFSTEPEFRRQGVAGEILDRLLEWLDGVGVTRIQLHAGTDEAQSVYRKAGFEDTSYANLWRRR